MATRTGLLVRLGPDQIEYSDELSVLHPWLGDWDDGIRVASIGRMIFCVVGSHLGLTSVAEDMSEGHRNRVEIGAMLMPWMGLTLYGAGAGGPCPLPTTGLHLRSLLDAAIRRDPLAHYIHPLHRNSRHLPEFFKYILLFMHYFKVRCSLMCAIICLI